MADILTLKGTGEVVILLKSGDIIDYVRRYMGNDAAKYVKGLICEMEIVKCEIEKMETELDECKDELCDYQHTSNSVWERVDSLQYELKNDQGTKSETLAVLSEIKKLMDDQI